MLKIEVTVTNGDDAARLSDVFAAIADALGASPTARAPRNTRRARGSASTADSGVSVPETNDPVAMYERLSTGQDVTVGSVAQTPPAAPDVAVPIEPRPAEDPTAPPAPPAHPPREKLLELMRDFGKSKGALWFREMLDTEKVAKLSDLPDAAILRYLGPAVAVSA